MTARTKATPAELDILAIVGSLVYDGHMELSMDEMADLEGKCYRAVADKFAVWALELLSRRALERQAADREAMAAICEAMDDGATEADLAKEYYDTTHTGVIEFGMCPP